MQGASPLASPRLRRRWHGLNLRCRCPLGGLPGWSPADLAVPESAGGACLPCRLPTPPFACFFAPIPPPPFPSGEGGEYYFISPGATAPGTPALNRLRHLQFLPSMSPAGGLPSLPPAFPAFGLLSCPLSPRPPSPPGKGEIFTFHMQGASPLASPGLNPRGTGSPCQSCTRRGCAFGISNPAQHRQNRFPMSSAASQGEGGPGEMELSVASDGGV